MSDIGMEFSLAEEQKLDEAARRAIVKPEALPAYLKLAGPENILRLLADHFNLRSQLEIAQVITEARQGEFNLLSANLHEVKHPRHQVGLRPPYTCQTCGWQARTED